MADFVRFRFRDGVLRRVFSGGMEVPVGPGEIIAVGDFGERIRHIPACDGRPQQVERYVERGPVNYRLSLVEDGLYKSGPSYGYRIKRPEEEADPVLRVARQIGIPVTKVVLRISEFLSPPAGGVRRSFGGASVLPREDGELIRPNRGGFVIDTIELPIRGGKGRFVSQLITGPETNPVILETQLRHLGLSHSPEWDVGEDMKSILRNAHGQGREAAELRRAS